MAPDPLRPGDFAAFREAMDASPIDAVVIHAVYLINCATKDKELRKKSLTSLTHALRTGTGSARTASSSTQAPRKASRTGPR